MGCGRTKEHLTRCQQVNGGTRRVLTAMSGGTGPTLCRLLCCPIGKTRLVGHVGVANRLCQRCIHRGHTTTSSLGERAAAYRSDLRVVASKCGSLLSNG